MDQEESIQSFIAVFVTEQGEVQIALNNYEPDLHGVALVLEAAATKIRFQNYEIQKRHAMEKVATSHIIKPGVG